MSSILAKASIAGVRALNRYHDELRSRGVPVLCLAGPVGKDKPVSERAVRGFVDTIGSAERVHLVINSEGGHVDEAGRIYCILRALPVVISAEVNMKAWSAAVTILLAADYRWARKDASILIHRTRMDLQAFPKEETLTAPALIRHAQTLYAADKREVDLLSFRTGFDRRWFEVEQANEDLLSEQEALRCGLLHAIEGKVPFSMENLQMLDRRYFSVDPRKPSEMLLANYRAAANVVAMEKRS